MRSIAVAMVAKRPWAASSGAFCSMIWTRAILRFRQAANWPHRNGHLAQPMCRGGLQSSPLVARVVQPAVFKQKCAEQVVDAILTVFVSIEQEMASFELVEQSSRAPVFRSVWPPSLRLKCGKSAISSKKARLSTSSHF